MDYSSTESVCNLHLKDYDCTSPLQLIQHPPEHLQQKSAFQTDSEFDAFVFRDVKRTLQEASFEQLDYDLYHVTFLLSVNKQTAADLKTSIQTVIAGFQPPHDPPTVSTHQRLFEMAKYLLDVIEKYEKAKDEDTLSPTKPFCLRYPTLKSLEDLVLQKSMKLKRVKYDHPVIFLDEAKRTIGMFIPPPRVDIIKRSELACLRASFVVGTVVKDPEIPLDTSPIDEYPVSPIIPSNIPHQPRFETSTQNNKKSISKNFIKETGHRLCSTFNAHVLAYPTGQEPPDWVDRSLRFESNGQVKQPDRQGLQRNEEHWIGASIGQHQLPKHSAYDQQYKQQEIAALTKNIRYWHIFNKLLNLAFAPKAYDRAEACIQTFIDNQNNINGSNVLTMTLAADHPNPSVGNITVSLNSQPSPHRDPKDGSVMVSDVVHTNALGGEFLMYEVGLALVCENGSQIVGRFDTLLHGIGKVKKDPNLPHHLTTRRTSLAIYSHHKIYEIAARYSALLQNLKSYSDVSLWLPLEDDQSHMEEEEIRAAAFERLKNQQNQFKCPDQGDKNTRTKDRNARAAAARQEDDEKRRIYNSKKKRKQIAKEQDGKASKIGSRS